MLRWLTAGESHGPCLVGIIDGVPSGLALTSEDIRQALARRRLGYGRGARQKFEQDQFRITSGVRHGVTTGAPISIVIDNSEWPKWQVVMSADPVNPEDLLIDAGKGDEREISRNKKLTRPRPGHADLVGMLKYDTDDARNILERASARETAMKVALGEVAAQILRQVAGCQVVSHVVGIGQVASAGNGELPQATDTESLDASPVRTLDKDLEAKMVAEIDRAKADANTIGGVVEVLAWDVPLGLGSHTQADRKLDGRIAGALIAVQAIKGVEFGDGFTTATRLGSYAHDEILRGDDGRIVRASNRAGGVEGGMSVGGLLRVRAAMKPISTVPRALQTVDLETGEAAVAIHQRSDVCAVPAAAVVCQAVVSLELAKALLEVVGNDNLRQCRENLQFQRHLHEKRLGE